MNDATNTGWQNNVKQVIRIAMIGLEPSQQILVKGYVRVLLRVDFDIEWVTPKKPNTNLYIVNHKFADADTVIALLQKQQAPVLYVEKHDSISNTIQDNVLYLKLEDIKLLEHWLHQHVPMIGPDGTYADIPAVAQSMTSESLPAFEAAAPVLSEQESPLQETQKLPSIEAQASSQMPSVEADTEILNDGTLALLKLINLHEQDEYFELYDGDQVIAVINPKQRLVWPQGDSFYPPYALNWFAQPSQNAHYKPEHAMNLSQWLWHVSQHEHSRVSDLLPIDAKLSLQTWPKPENDEKKSDVLKVLSLIELRASSAQEISEFFRIDITEAHKMLAALYLSGFIDTDGLSSVDVLARRQMEKQSKQADSTSQLNGHDVINGSVSDTVEHNVISEAHQELLAEAEILLTEQIEQRKQVVEQSGGFGGLLSRIRSSLGF